MKKNSIRAKMLLGAVLVPMCMSAQDIKVQGTVVSASRS